MRRSTARTRRVAGFTLMEMLVVTAILAILAAVLFPVLARARGKAHQASCTNNLRQIYVAHTLYERDWNGRFPPWHNIWTASTGAGYQAQMLHSALNAYAGSKDIWYCKSAVYKHQAVVWSGIDQRYTGYVLPYVRWRHRLVRVAGSPYQTPDQVPIAGDPSGMPGGRDTPGLEYHGLPHFEGSVIVWADGHAKWKAGVFPWQAVYP